MRLELPPIERVRRLTPLEAPNVGGALKPRAASSSMIVIGEVAGALHGWPLVLSAAAVEV